MDVLLRIRRTAAVGAGASGILHLLMLGHGGHLGWSLLMTAMAIVCLPCAGHLWRMASVRSWTLIGVMNCGMLVMHLGMLASKDSTLPVADSALTSTTALVSAAGARSAVAQAHNHGDSVISLAGLHPALLPLATAVAALEMLLAGLGWYLLRRADRAVARG
ncbi:hypothetical protein [Nesterenkonia sp. Act20]|uniref:hypothetical protein n=1 Tax=Nesterenkonia sp. Act20 TaxID=1483432 RepID=UPI001C48705D|nr:hypothetical protein [Nesterenkonia sp. Act20]